jgi:hypothetical protein
MHCLLSVVSTLIDFGYMHVCDWASHAFLPMILCKGCSLAKIQHHSLSSLIRVPHHHFTYDTVLRNSHCERPNHLQRCLQQTIHQLIVTCVSSSDSIIENIVVEPKDGPVKLEPIYTMLFTKGDPMEITKSLTLFVSVMRLQRQISIWI